MRTTERITEVTVQHENGTQWVFVYYLQIIHSKVEGDLYALRVDKLSRDGILLERAETYALTDSRQEALTMVNAFAKGTVPPSVLNEVADEWEWPIQSTPVHTYHRAG
jgi:negative regulator of sigma E activity